MKFVTAIILGCSLLSTGLLLAQQGQPRGCACKNCKCNERSHCGCFSNRGCACGENCSCGSNCGCGGRLLSVNGFHHGNADEHENEGSV